MKSKTTSGRKKRYSMHNAPLHRRHRGLGAHLSAKYLGDEKVVYPRGTVVRKGDIVKIMRGLEKGKEGKVTEVDVNTGRVSIEGITMAKADGKQVTRGIHASKLMIVKLNLDDKLRKQKLSGGKE